MNDDQLAMIMARTDAAVGLLLTVLVEKGVVSSSELGAMLDNAADAVGVTSEGAVIATVFVGMRALLNRKQKASGSTDEGARILQ